MNPIRIQAAVKDVGGIPVARSLPAGSKRRTIGAWCFLDHAGPAQFGAEDHGMQVGLHPHTNLQTFTWMLQGEMLHQDSLGNRQTIRAKQVNLMTAGTGAARGISHTEQTPEGVKELHAVQLWIALPMDQDIEAAFENYPTLPVWTEGSIEYTVVTGTYQGHSAPTKQYSPLLGLYLDAPAGGTAQLSLQAGFEYGVLVVGGSVQIDGQTAAQDELLVFDAQTAAGSLNIELASGSRVFLLGGEPLPHPTVIWWNFVDQSKEGLMQSVADWNAGHPRFGHIDIEGSGLKRLPAPALPEGFKES